MNSPQISEYYCEDGNVMLHFAQHVRTYPCWSVLGLAPKATWAPLGKA